MKECTFTLFEVAECLSILAISMNLRLKNLHVPLRTFCSNIACADIAPVRVMLRLKFSFEELC
ncbi:hypothetical protein T07_4373 [Trichinella nelsoni]|uniref:Uncharacterized protein n=1 Tax=Trichinella nelsoni TaxID=6336 RepID=A0A0V0SBT8_9BILA|nr:hypothetical protein T07_4373 [Trichinella nelsoni]